MRISLPPDIEEMRHITVTLPVPSYRFAPMPFYNGRPIPHLVEAFSSAVKLRRCRAIIQDDPKRGKMLKLYIPKLSRGDVEQQTHRLDVSISSSASSPYFANPFILFLQASSLFSLTPFQASWSWKKENTLVSEDTSQNKQATFSAFRYVKSDIFSKFPGERINLGLYFKFKKRIGFGHTAVEYFLGAEGSESEIIISRQGWQLLSVYLLQEKSWL